jgi:hypothetical protein
VAVTKLPPKPTDPSLRVPGRSPSARVGCWRSVGFVRAARGGGLGWRLGEGGEGERERERESQSRAGLMSFTKEPAKMPVKLIR